MPNLEENKARISAKTCLLWDYFPFMPMHPYNLLLIIIVPQYRSVVGRFIFFCVAPHQSFTISNSMLDIQNISTGVFMLIKAGFGESPARTCHHHFGRANHFIFFKGIYNLYPLQEVFMRTLVPTVSKSLTLCVCIRIKSLCTGIL